MKLKKVEELREIISEDFILILDTNTLLKPYLYSTNTQRIILELFQQNFFNIWLPAQVKTEYLKNEKSVKENGYKKYHNLINKIKSAYKDANKTARNQLKEHQRYDFPMVSQLRDNLDKLYLDVIDKIEEYERSIKSEIIKNKEEMNKGDFEKFAYELFDEGKVGAEFTTTQLIEIYKEGEVRFNYKIPPGFKDVNKDKRDESKRDKFGDLILWKQILHKAKKDDKNIIFVIDDTKNDWWDKESDEPRKELLSEMNEYAILKNSFFMLGLQDFINLFSEIDQIDATEAILEIEANDIIITSIMDNDCIKNEYLEEIDEIVIDEYFDGIVNDMKDQVGLEGECIELHYHEVLDFGEHDLDFIKESEIKINSSLNLILYYQLLDEYDKKIGELSVSLYVDFDMHADLIIEQHYNYTLENIDLNVNFTSLNGFDYEVNEDLVCVNCNSNKGRYLFSNGGFVCESCVSGGSEIELCTKCGKTYPFGEITGEFCEDCTNKEVFI